MLQILHFADLETSKGKKINLKYRKYKCHFYAKPLRATNFIKIPSPVRAQ